MQRRRLDEHTSSELEQLDPEAALHAAETPRRGLLFRPKKWAGRLRTETNRSYTPDWVDEAFSLAGLGEETEKEGEA